MSEQVVDTYEKLALDWYREMGGRTVEQDIQSLAALLDECYYSGVGTRAHTEAALAAAEQRVGEMAASFMDYAVAHGHMKECAFGYEASYPCNCGHDKMIDELGDCPLHPDRKG